jgi:hypothetical protein
MQSCAGVTPFFSARDKMAGTMRRLCGMFSSLKRVRCARMSPSTRKKNGSMKNWEGEHGLTGDVCTTVNLSDEEAAADGSAVL